MISRMSAVQSLLRRMSERLDLHADSAGRIVQDLVRGDRGQDVADQMRLLADRVEGVVTGMLLCGDAISLCDGREREINISRTQHLRNIVIELRALARACARAA